MRRSGALDKRCEWEDPGLMEKLPSGTVTFLFTDGPSYGLVKLNPPPALTAPRIGPTASPASSTRCSPRGGLAPRSCKGQGGGPERPRGRRLIMDEPSLVRCFWDRESATPPINKKDAAAKLLSLFTAARRKATYRLVRHSFREQVRRLSCKPHEGASRERFVADHAEHASRDCFRRDKLRHCRPIFRAHLRE
jgi:hypothetical protein